MNEKRNDDIYYVCTMIEYVARVTKNHRKDIVARISKKDMEHELKVAEVNHCLSFEQVSDEWIEQYGIVEGNFDTVTTCKYNVPSVTSIGRVYQQLVLATAEKDEEAQAIKDVFASFISDEISYFNSNVYYSNPDYLRCSYQEGTLLAQIAQYVKNALDYIKANPWEQRKLGDEAIEMVAGGDIDKSLLDEHGKYPVIANALTDDGIVGYYASDYRIKAPAVTVTGRGDVGHAKARTVDFTPVVRLLSVRSKHDVFFLENAINTLNVIVESTGVPQLTVPQLSQYEIFFPPTITEEKEIGAFFDRVDNLITLHQRKAKMLQFIKIIMVEKMFVSQ